jgi:hypothetical protein
MLESPAFNPPTPNCPYVVPVPLGKPRHRKLL